MSVLDAIAKQYENNKSGNSTSTTSYEQDFSKYFAVRLEDGANDGEMTIRIMPPKTGVHPQIKDTETPFDEGHWHYLKVGGKWRKIYCRKHNDGEECPLCNVTDELYQSWKDTGNKEDKELANQYKAKKFYIARLIDREKEDDGIKFWRFPHNYKGAGVFDKMIAVFSEKGDISDAKEGRDLIINIGKDDRGNSVVSSIIHDDREPLGTEEQVAEWISDTMTWEDVFSKRDYDYLSKVARGENPYEKKETSSGEVKKNQSDEEEVMDDEQPF